MPEPSVSGAPCLDCNCDTGCSLYSPLGSRACSLTSMARESSWFVFINEETLAALLAPVALRQESWELDFPLVQTVERLSAVPSGGNAGWGCFSIGGADFNFSLLCI